MESGEDRVERGSGGAAEVWTERRHRQVWVDRAQAVHDLAGDARPHVRCDNKAVVATAGEEQGAGRSQVAGEIDLHADLLQLREQGLQRGGVGEQ